MKIYDPKNTRIIINLDKIKTHCEKRITVIFKNGTPHTNKDELLFIRQLIDELINKVSVGDIDEC